MSIHSNLFVGGPYDGQRKVFEGTTVTVQELLDSPGVVAFRAGDFVKTKTTNYKLLQLRAGEETVLIWVPVFASEIDALRLLVDGYRQGGGK